MLFDGEQDAINWLEDRDVVLPEEYYGLMQDEQRARAFSVAGEAALDQLQAVLDSLGKAMRNGVLFEDWAADILSNGLLGLPLHRLDNIYRTNIQAAYNAAKWKSAVANKRFRPYMMYSAINDSRTRPSHLAMDRIIKPVDDPFWTTHYPPNGYRCRCTVVTLNEKQLKQLGGITPDGKISPDARPDDGWHTHVGDGAGDDMDSRAAELNSNTGYTKLSVVLLDALRARTSAR